MRWSLLNLTSSRTRNALGGACPTPLHFTVCILVVVVLLLSRSVVSDSVRPYRQQPPRLPHLWDFLGKSTGVGRHCLLCLVLLPAKSLQSCPTLCDPMDCSLPGFSVQGILQARTPEWVAISLSNAGKWKLKVKSLSHVQLLATPWTAVYQALPSMGFSRQQYWSGVPLPSLF